MNCPTCGAAFANKDIVVDLNTNTAVIRDRVVNLSPREAEVLKVLQNASPRFITCDTITRMVVGDSDGERAGSWPRVYINRLRKKLAGTAVNIETGRRGAFNNGFRLVGAHP